MRVLNELALEYQRVPAVDGRKWSREKIASFVSDECGAFPNGGEIGCFLSHQQCWEIAASSNHDYTLILEDDIIPSSDASLILKNLNIAAIQSDVIYLEMEPGRTWIGNPIVPLGNGYDIGRLKSDESGSAAYIVSRNGARKLIASSVKYSEPVDLLLFSNLRHSMNILTVRPGIFCQEMYLKPKIERSATTIYHPAIEVKIKQPKSIFTRITNEMNAGRRKLVRYLQGERRYKADFSRFL